MTPKDDSLDDDLLPEEEKEETTQDPAPPDADPEEEEEVVDDADADDVDTKLSTLDDAIDEVRAQADEIDERVQLNDNNTQKVRWTYPHYGTWLGGGSGGAGFNGICYDRAGNKTVLGNNPSKLWIRYNQSSGVFSEEVGPPSEPWGADELWRKKEDIQGSLYLQ